MWDVLKSDEDFNKYIDKEVFVRFDVNPKLLTCCGNVKDFLEWCSNERNNLKDGFYKLAKDNDDLKDRHRFTIHVNGEPWSVRHDFIKEVYGIKGDILK